MRIISFSNEINAISPTYPFLKRKISDSKASLPSDIKKNILAWSDWIIAAKDIESVMDHPSNPITNTTFPDVLEMIHKEYGTDAFIDFPQNKSYNFWLLTMLNPSLQISGDELYEKEKYFPFTIQYQTKARSINMI